MPATVNTTRMPRWQPPAVFWTGAIAVAAALGAGVFLLTQTNNPRTGARPINVSRQILFPTGLSVRWQGSVGSSSAALMTFLSEGGGLPSGTITYQGVEEKLSIEVRDDGFVTLKGTSYRRASGNQPFNLDTFAGKLSADGTTLQGTYSDTAGNRGQWQFRRGTVVASHHVGTETSNESVAAQSGKEDEQVRTGNLSVTHAVIGERLNAAQQPEGVSTQFNAPAEGTKGVVYYANYQNGTPGQTRVSVRWYRGGLFLSDECPYTLTFPSGYYYCNYSYTFTPGTYQARIVVDGQETVSTAFAFVSREAPGSSSPEIVSVSAIVPQANQTISITGNGFGNQGPYNGNSAYILITDLTRNWNAGNTSGNDLVTLGVAGWTDTQITIRGFTGAYGGSWSLGPGDQVRIQVWNPQTGAGPATSNVTVAPQNVQEDGQARPGMMAGRWYGTAKNSSTAATFQCVFQQVGTRVTGWARESLEGSREVIWDISGSLDGRTFRFVDRNRGTGQEMPCSGTVTADWAHASGTCSSGSETSSWEMWK